MRAFEILRESSKEKNELKDLIKKSDNASLLAKILGYLQSKVQPEPESEQPVTEDTGNVKSQVFAMLDRLDDNSPEWEKLIAILRKDELTELATRAVEAKLGSVNQRFDKKLRDMVMRLKVPFDQKERFLETLAKGGGFFDGKQMVSTNTGNVYNMIKDPVAKQLAPMMSVEMQGEQGYGPSQGPGEMMMVLLGTNIDLATKGDLNIGNRLIEVKATTKGKKNDAGGRLYSTKGYGTNTSLKRQLVKLLQQLGIPLEELAKYGIPKPVEGLKPIAGRLNLNPTGLNNYNTLIQQFELGREGTQKIFTLIMNELWNELPTQMGQSMFSIINADGTFDPKDFLIEMTKIAHLYYVMMAGHDTVMVFNVNSGNYALIESGEDVERLLKSGAITLGSHLDLNDDRGQGSSQIIIK